MYRVTVLTNGVEYPLHEPRDDSGELQLIDPVVTLEMGKNGEFTFRISPLHPHIEQILALKSEIYVYSDEELIFCGRHIGKELDFHNIGKVTCEGEMAYLLDSMQRPYNFTGSGADFFRQVLQAHNSQVEERKRFEVGNITVADNSPEIQRINAECTDTLETLKTQLVGINGGYLMIRRASGKKYLDYVHDYGGTNSQVIRFGENLLDLTRHVKPTGIITALIPYGAAIENDNTDEEEKRLDITSVNGGKDYIFNQAAVNTYGWIWGAKTWDDITDPEALLAKANAYLQESIALPETLDLTALDLGIVDVDIQKLRLGYWTQVESTPHGISKLFMLSKKIIHLDNPGKDEIILGQTLTTFTGAANKDKLEISNRINRVAESTSREINRKVENATQLITGGKGGYVVLDVEDPDTGTRALPWRILIMDTPDKDTAMSVIQINKNGIGFSTTGINGPYRNAWTIDGNLVADFITAGTMLADRIRGGTLELGGTGLGKDGSIVVRNASGAQIGYWDKTGLHISKGTITGGSININNGTFRVTEDGEVTIRTGTLDIGPLSADEGGVYLGDYAISIDGTNELRSSDGSVAIQTAQGGPFGEYATIKLSSASGTTTLTDHHLETPFINAVRINGDCELFGDNWWTTYTLFEALDYLNDKINNLGG